MNVDTSQGFPEMDHSGSTARMILEQNKFSKKVTSTGIESGTLGLR